jgi:hypothetical protein
LKHATRNERKTAPELSERPIKSHKYQSILITVKQLSSEGSGDEFFGRKKGPECGVREKRHGEFTSRKKSTEMCTET